MMSTGKFCSRPWTIANGVHPVEECTDDRYAIITKGRWSSQSLALSQTNAESICRTERLKRSTRPSDCGRYGVVRILVDPSISTMDRKSWLSNSVPWSECICLGTPWYITKRVTNSFATSCAVWRRRGKASVHFVK